MKPQICVMRFQAWVTQGNCVMKHEICVGLVWSRRELCREAPNLCHEDFGPLGRGNCHTSHTGARALMLQISLRERPFCIPPRKPHFGRAPSDVSVEGLKLRMRLAIGETMPKLEPHEYRTTCDTADDCSENEHSQSTPCPFGDTRNNRRTNGCRIFTRRNISAKIICPCSLKLQHLTADEFHRGVIF